MVMTQVKSYLAQTIKDGGISVLEIDERLMDLSSALRDRLNEYLREYGLEMTEFFVSRVITPDDDPNYRKMREQYAAQYLLVREEQIKKQTAEAAAERKAVEARTEAQMKIISAQGEAEALKVKAVAEAEAYKVQAEAEASEMKMKGYTYQQETARQVGMEAMQNGLTGGGSSGASALGDLAGLGVGLGAMGSVIGMTKDAMSPALDTVSAMEQSVGNTISGVWDCTCGQKGIVGKFCSNCGTKKPEIPLMDVWDCSCGVKGNVGNFCSNCGAKRPEKSDVWNCSCGQMGIVGNFCNNCGKKRGE
jgi:hypothetical protein